MEKLDESNSSLINELHQSTKIIESDFISKNLSSSGYKIHPIQKLYHWQFEHWKLKLYFLFFLTILMTKGKHFFVYDFELKSILNQNLFVFLFGWFIYKEL